MHADTETAREQRAVLEHLQCRRQSARTGCCCCSSEVTSYWGSHLCDVVGDRLSYHLVTELCWLRWAGQS